jgi:hypothetical protein
MPIEIRELIVKITIEDTNRKKSEEDLNIQELKNKIIKECVDKVMLKLDRQTQR